MAAEGAGTLILFLKEAPRETPLFDRLTSTQRAPKAVEGFPTLAPFSLKSHWKSMDINENQCKSMKIYENSMKINEINGNH